ncbi:MAG: hypothetical protein ABSH51_19435 [Solirubrobacteraceae bacterium]
MITGSTPGGGLTETLTGAGGSISILCQQTATPIGNTGVLQGVDRWTVTGASGQFSNVTGSGTGTTYIDNLKAFDTIDAGVITP